MFRKIDAFSMTGEEWTEPTQQTDSATKATLTGTDDRPEKATTRQRNKERNIQNQCKAPCRASCPQSQRLLTNSKQLLCIHLSSFQFCKNIFESW